MPQGNINNCNNRELYKAASFDFNENKSCLTEDYSHEEKNKTKTMDPK